MQTNEQHWECVANTKYRIKETSVELGGKYLRYVRHAILWMALKARLGEWCIWCSRTLILNEHFHLFFILDVICYVNLQQLPTHSLQHSLSEHWCSIFMCSSWETTRERDFLINPPVTNQIPNLKINNLLPKWPLIPNLIPKVRF